MQIRRFLPALPLLFAGASAQLINIPQLDIGLLQNGALINIGVFGNILGTNTCPASNIAVRTTLLGLVRACVCLNLLNPGADGGGVACPACPANASPVCGGAGVCACQCNAGFYASATGTCVPNSNCAPPNVLTATGSTATCTCAAGYVSDGAGGCVLTPSARARRARHRRSFPYKHGQEVFAPQSSEQIKPAFSCPDGETACRLPSGGFECIDTETSLNSCGGCVGEGMPGQNCLAIPGALAVECHQSKCHVGSCFKGWRHVKDGNGKCV
ncbi:hypothetical protein JCM10207_006002 [Rhodosporidiobolus poonsookiae]